MSVEGSISASALFHDKDGTTTMKVVSLDSVESPSTGRVAIVTGTCSSAGVTIDLADTGYVAADGSPVNWDATSQSIHKIVFSASPWANAVGNGPLREFKMSSKEGDVCMTKVPHGGFGSAGTYTYSVAVTPESFTTATYTLVIYGD